MDPLEQELKRALERQDPSPDFAERVRWNLHVQRHRPGSGLQWWLSAAAALMIAGGVGYRQYQGNVAREQLMQAFRIAGAEVHHIQSEVRELGR